MTAERDTSRDVAVVGMACRFSDAPDLPTFWDNVVGGHQAFAPIPKSRWDHSYFHSEKSRAADKTYVQKGAFIDDVDQFAALEFGIAPKRVEVMDPQHRLALEVSREALQDAGFFRHEVNRRRVGTFLGVVTSEYRNLTTARSNALLYATGAVGNADGQAASDLVENGLPITAFSMPGTLLNMTAANVARQWKFGGPAFTIDAACTSSLAAIHDAVTHIRAGICDAAIAGGVYLNLTPESLVGFSRIGAISKSGFMRPFDENADGFLQGDGCGIVVLKSYDKAIEDGDRIYAVVRGTGINNDGDSPGPMAPSRIGQNEAVVRAYEDAQIDPKSVGFVACHGTATPVGDPVEVGALADAMKGADHPIFLGSIKGNVGHTMGAAGVAGFIHATMAVHTKTISPQAGFQTPHPKLELEQTPFEIPTEPVVWEGNDRVAGVSAFGFGGTNCHVVLTEAPTPVESQSLETARPIVVSAASIALLGNHARAIADTVETNGYALADVAYTLNQARKIEDVRLVVVATTSEEFVDTLRSAADLLDQGVTDGKLGPNAFVGTKTSDDPVRVGFMFPGQGAQHVGLLEDLYDSLPQFNARLDHYVKVAGLSTDTTLYPETRDDAADVALRQTEVCQPVMASIGLALSDTLASFGVTPTVSFGHSLGEFVATAAAGLIGHDDAIRFVADRGRLMANLDLADRGTMAAAMASRNDVAPHLQDGAVIANLNHAKQTVVSGTTEAVEATVAALTANGIKSTVLRVSHAFHSPVIEPVAKALTQRVGELQFNTPESVALSAISVAPYDVTTAPEVFVDHAMSPVNFVDTMSLADDLADVFVEVGAGTTLTSFKSANDRTAKVVSLGGKKPDDGYSFARALAQLVTWGLDIAMTPFGTANVISLPASPLVREKYWARRDKVTPLTIPGQTLSAGSKERSGPVMNQNDALVELFQQQAEILRQHAAIIAQQNAVLGGANPASISVPGLQHAQSAELSALRAASGTGAEEATSTAGANGIHATSGAGAKDEPDYHSLVIGAVGEISAFPLASLKPKQGLVTDLGFDSLMFVDLISELQKQIPGLVVPQNAFDQTSTIQDVIDFVSNVSNESVQVEDVSDMPIQTFGVQWAAVDTDVKFDVVDTGRVLAIGFDSVPTGVTGAATVSDVNITEFDSVIVKTDATLNVVDRIKQLRTIAAATPNVSLFVHVTDDRVQSPSDAACAGFVRALAMERPNAVVKNVDGVADFSEVVEFASQKNGCVDATFDGAAWLTKQLAPAEPRTEKRLKSTDIVLVTGGTGAVGRVLAATVAPKVKEVIVVGRRSEADVANALSAIGSNVTYLQSDLSSLDLQKSVDWVFHCAGVNRDAHVEQKTDAQIDEVFGGKVAGLDVLHHACPDATFVCASSWSGFLGNAGQTDYAAANAFLDTWCEATGGVSIAWPIWDGEGMGASISENVRETLAREGVTFIAPGEAASTFAQTLEQGLVGHLFVARIASPRFASDRVVEPLSTKSHPFVTDHVLKDKPVLPFAYVLDRVTRSAKRTRGWSAVEVSNFVLSTGIEVEGDQELFVSTQSALARVDVSVEMGGTLRYAAKARGFDGAAAEVPTLTGGPAKLDLEEFYAKLAFHGPLMRAIESVDQVGERHLVGYVKTSKPSDWLTDANNTEWTADPKVIDGALQLVLYFLRSTKGVAAFPNALDRYVQLRPFVGDNVKCTMTLESLEDDEVIGAIYFEDDTGLVAWMDRLQARVFETGTEQKVAVDVPEHFYNIAKFEEVEELQQRLQMADLMGIANPYFRAHEGVAKNTAVINGREMLNFSSYNYLGLAGHTTTVAAAKEAIDIYGTSASASRVASGQIPIHEELEYELADLMKAEAALVFAAGHMTNETCIGHLFGKNDLIIHDALAHNSILTGAELSGAKRMSFPHNDYEALDRTLTQLRGEFEKVGIFIEGVYSMDGDIPDVPKFVELRNKHKALLYVDEAHSIGVVGEGGGGVREYFGLKASDADVWMGTLSKAFASCGGYVAGSQALIDFLKYTAPAFVFSAGISPANAAAALAAIKEMKRDQNYVQTLHARSDFFLNACNDAGLDTGMSKDSAVVPVIIGSSIECLQLSENLSQRDINVQPIVYPAVDDSESRLRFFLSATHTEDELQHTATVVAEELTRVRSGAAAE